MKCKRCGEELSYGASFCSYCGEIVEINTSNSVTNETSESEYEKIDNQTTPWLKKEMKSITDDIKEQGLNIWEKLSSYEKVITIALAIFTIMCVVAFSTGRAVAGFVALSSIVFTVNAVLMKKKIIKAPKDWMHIAVLAFAAVLIIPYFILYTGIDESNSIDKHIYSDGAKYKVTMKVECDENWIFSKYDVDIYVDDSFEGSLPHGTDSTYSIILAEGVHNVKFVNSNNDNVTGNAKINVNKDENFKFEISCHSDMISIKSRSDAPNGNNDAYVAATELVENESIEQTEDQSTESIKSIPTEQTENEKQPERVYYSSNDYETARKGNSGVFSYCSKGKEYDIYWIIDFDEGYVYSFTEGNGDEGDKAKIVSGDLNNRVVITYHDNDRVASWGLYFKYVNQPVTLMVQDDDGFEYKFSATDLDEALRIRDTKIIKEY